MGRGHGHSGPILTRVTLNHRRWWLAAAPRPPRPPPWPLAPPAPGRGSASPRKARGGAQKTTPRALITHRLAGDSTARKPPLSSNLMRHSQPALPGRDASAVGAGREPSAVGVGEELHAVGTHGHRQKALASRSASAVTVAPRIAHDPTLRRHCLRRRRYRSRRVTLHYATLFCRRYSLVPLREKCTTAHLRHPWHEGSERVLGSMAARLIPLCVFSAYFRGIRNKIPSLVRAASYDEAFNALVAQCRGRSSPARFSQ